MTSSTAQAAALEDPISQLHAGGDDTARIDRAEREALQLAGLQQRFGSLRSQIAVLTVLADKQGITSMNAAEDAAPLLFEHKMYKSYPAKLLLRYRFADLTRWLQRLTAVDLSNVPLEGVTSIDGWLDALETHTSLRPSTSSGTGGTMSFLPISTVEMRARDSLGVGPDEYLDVVWPNFARGTAGPCRMAEIVERSIAGGPERFHALHPGRMSADLQLLAARVRIAQMRDERLDIDESLRARLPEFEAQQLAMKEAVPRFLSELDRDVRGKRVFLVGLSNIVFQLAQMGIERGIENLFASDSIVIVGGGGKGTVLPADYEDVIARFTGVPTLGGGYSMSELNSANQRCDHGDYHIAPTSIFYVLDPATGKVLPREGAQTGRAAFFDLLAQTYWGGFVTGDEVTVDWSPCMCGRTTPRVKPTIRRYSEMQGGDDKITCAATEEAQALALNFLTGELE